MIHPLRVPFPRPTLAELVTRIGADLRGRLEIDGPLLRRAMADVLSAVWGGAVHLLYGALDWTARQVFADTADRDQLLQIASLYKITPVAASFATGDVVATGANGSVILAGAILRLDAATAYRVATGGTIALGTAALPVVAVLAGVAGNLDAGASLSFESAIAGVTSTVLVDVGGIAGGVDEEGTEEVRDRLLLRLRRPPAGGAEQDYIAWALAVAGVTRAWVFPNELGLGTVVVRFVLDGDPVSIFPDAGEVAAVQAAIDARRPITAVATAAAPTALAVAFTIHLVPDTTDTRAAVTAELTDMLQRLAEPGDGAGRGTILLSSIRTAIGIAEGVDDYTVTVPSANVIPGVGQLPTLGVITWT